MVISGRVRRRLNGFANESSGSRRSTDMISPSGSRASSVNKMIALYLLRPSILSMSSCSLVLLSLSEHHAVGM